MMEELTTGWLSPQGDMIECDPYNHIFMAQEIADKYRYKNICSIPVDDLLLENGWVHIARSSIGKIEWCIYWNGHLSPSQVNIVRKYYEDTNTPMSLGSAMNFEMDLDR